METRKRWMPVDRALAGLSLPMMMSSLDTSIANAGLPTFARAFGATFAEVQWIALAYLLATTTLIVTVGHLGDTVGRRRLLLSGIGLFTAASMLCGLAPTLGLLVVARALQGVGAAVMMALTLASVGETVPKEQVGRTMGLLGTMSAVGTALGPPLGGFLTALLGWRAIFLVNVPLGLLAMVLVHQGLPDDRPGPAADRTGFGSVGMLLRDPVLGAGLAMGLLVAAVMMSTLVVGPFYLAHALGLDPAHVGLVLSVGPLVVVLAGVPAGRLVDRFGARPMTLVGLLGTAIGSVALSQMRESLGVPGYIVPIAIMTAGYALFQAANNTAVMMRVRPDQRGVTSGMLSLARNLGLITGASALGALFSFASGTGVLATARPEAVAAGMRATFGVSVILVTVAIALAVGGRIRSTVSSTPCTHCADPASGRS